MGGNIHCRISSLLIIHCVSNTIITVTPACALLGRIVLAVFGKSSEFLAGEINLAVLDELSRVLIEQREEIHILTARDRICTVTCIVYKINIFIESKSDTGSACVI